MLSASEAATMKTGSNDPCPCGSGNKYKRCCYGTVDWDRIFQNNLDWRPYLSLRGRNLQFLNRICEALQIDGRETNLDLSEFKSAFTARAVRDIHEAVVDLWPRNIDILGTLSRTATEVSGLYIGDYDLEYISRGIVRHSIYANKILIVDPFVYPYSVRDKFNPILNPGQFRTQTLRNVNFWFALYPWIDAGIVEIIRIPSDFDPSLHWESFTRHEQKLKEQPELRSASDESVDEFLKWHKDRTAFQDFVLSAPDGYLERNFSKFIRPDSGISLEHFLAFVRRERERDPDFLKPLDDLKESQLRMFFTGASYDVARITANITKSYLVNDILAKWKEIELDRESHSAQNKVWAPFAKAMQEAELKYLNSLDLQHALKLRKEERLQGLRNFLLEVWKKARTEEPFDAANSVLPAQELTERVREAELEWHRLIRTY
jgi:hypothetical protein